MKLLVYPFNKENSFLVRGHFDSLLDIQTIPVAPRAFGLYNKDTSFCDGGLSTGINVRCDFDDALNEADSALFVSVKSYENTTDYVSKISKVLQQGKTPFITKSVVSLLSQFPKLIQLSFVVSDPIDTTSNIDSLKLLSCDVPIIAITSISDECDQALVTSHLSYWFTCNGYKVSTLTNIEYGSILNWHVYPSFMDKFISHQDKVVLFNRYIHQITINEKPDIFILSIPHGVMPLNPFQFDGFGDYARTICDAVTVDCGLLCVPSEKYAHNYIDAMRNICKYRYGIDIRSILLSSQILRINQETDNISFVTGNYKYAESCLNATHTLADLPVILTQDFNSIDSICSHLFSNIAV